MLRYALMAIAAATVIAVVFVMLPTGGGQRPEPRILSPGDITPSAGFVIHPAAPPDPNKPAVAATPSGPGTAVPSGDLDTVMQRLRAGAAKPDATAPQTPPAVPAPTSPPAAPATPPTALSTDAAASAPPRWSSVTAQGTRWRMGRSDNGYVVSIDLGGGQVADVHVQQAFGNLDTASVNVRVDYLRETILQNFPRQSATYSFARDGSISLQR